MTATATATRTPKAPATPTAVTCEAAGGRAVMADALFGGARFYYLLVPSPRDAEKLTRVEFHYPDEPEFRVAQPGTDPLPAVRIDGHQDPAKAPKYVQKAVAEVLEAVAAWEARYQWGTPRTPEQHAEIGPRLTRAQHAEMLGLHQDHLAHLDRATVVAVLRAAVENGWATPDDVSELESEREKAAGQLQEHENDEESRTRTTKAFEELIAETGKFLDGYNGIGVPFDNYTPAQREQVLDDARHLEAAMDEALNATC